MTTVAKLRQLFMVPNLVISFSQGLALSLPDFVRMSSSYITLSFNNSFLIKLKTGPDLLYKSMDWFL